MLLTRRPANRRKFRRISIQPVLAMVHEAAASQSAGDTWPPCLSEDISPDGLFLRTTRAFPVGQRLLLQLHLPTMTKPLTCQAQVTRVERRLGGKLEGVGLQFLEPSEPFLQTLIEHLYRSYQAQYARE